jgi:hypothetical protein
LQIFAEEIIDFIRPLTDVKITKLPNSATYECELSKALDEVTWLKDGQPITKKDKRYQIIASGTVHKLVVKDLDGRDEGEYTVVAKSNKSKATLAINGELEV